MQRYGRIRQIMSAYRSRAGSSAEDRFFTEKLDNLLPPSPMGIYNPARVLFLLFQSVFWIAISMDAIDWTFSQLGGWLGHVLPEVWWSNC